MGLQNCPKLTLYGLDSAHDRLLGGTGLEGSESPLEGIEDGKQVKGKSLVRKLAQGVLFRLGAFAKILKVGHRPHELVPKLSGLVLGLGQGELQGFNFGIAAGFARAFTAALDDFKFFSWILL